ncbi:MAG TPA: hypothetical protein VGC91_16765 [Pyrinomonadaceae bacterium]
MFLHCIFRGLLTGGLTYARASSVPNRFINRQRHGGNLSSNLADLA